MTTNRERAEKIVKIFMSYDTPQAPFYESVLSEIRAAVEEATADLSKDANIILEGAFDAAKAEAFECAAKIAEHDCRHRSCWCAAERIRAKAKEI